MKNKSKNTPQKTSMSNETKMDNDEYDIVLEEILSDDGMRRSPVNLRATKEREAFDLVI